MLWGHMLKYTVVIDKDLEDIVPGYLESRRAELPLLKAAAAASDLETLRKVGHKLAGSGGGYGFDRLSEVGKALETAAAAGDAPGCSGQLAALEEYLLNLEVSYE